MDTQTLKTHLVLISRKIEELKQELIPTYFQSEEELREALEGLDERKLQEEIESLIAELKALGVEL